MRRLLVTLALAGCASETGGGGLATTTIDADLVVVAIIHEKVGIDVYKTNDFLMTGNCRSLRGKILDSEMATLKSYMADELIQSLGRDCGGGANEYRITIGSGAQSRCWTTDQKGAALQGLTKFFDEKAAEHAKAPEGICDGRPQDVGPSNWAKNKAAAGSGG